jgi:hypothetical protein
MNSLKQTTRIIHLDEIETILEGIFTSHIIDSIQDGFIAYFRHGKPVSWQETRLLNWVMSLTAIQPEEHPVIKSAWRT